MIKEIINAEDKLIFKSSINGIKRTTDTPNTYIQTNYKIFTRK